MTARPTYLRIPVTLGRGLRIVLGTALLTSLVLTIRPLSSARATTQSLRSDGSVSARTLTVQPSHLRDATAREGSRSPANTVTTANLSLTPTSGPYNTKVMVTGSSFSAGEAVNVYWDNLNSTPLVTTTAATTGTISTSFRVPQATWGMHSVIAVGRTSGATGNAPFHILPSVVLQQTSASQNTAESVHAYGYAAGETVNVFWNSSILIGSGVANSVGTAIVTVVVPLAPIGSYTVSAVGQTSGATASSSFHLIPALSISPTLGTPGASALVWGSGYGVGETVTVYWDCSTRSCSSTTVLGTATTDSNGDFRNLSVIIPSGVSQSQYKLGGKGASSAGFAAVSFSVGGFALASPTPCTPAAGSCWLPPVISRWQYQLQGSRSSSGACLYPSTGFINTGITGTSFATGQTVAPVVFDIDIYQDGSCYTPNNYAVLNTAAVQALHARGDHVVGYIDAGTSENWRPDYSQYVSFNQSCSGCLFGNTVSGFSGEHWLNINASATGINPNTGQRETTRQFILDELSARLGKLSQAGFDAVEFDNVDGYQNSTGFSISYDTQLLFNTALANMAHASGVAVGLKNDLGQLSNLKAYFDFAINEQCFQYQECNYPPPGYPDWVVAGKAIFQVEYQRLAATFCSEANSWDFNSIQKNVNLYDTPWIPCR